MQKSEGDAVEEKATLDLNIVQLETPELDFEMVHHCKHVPVFSGFLLHCGMNVSLYVQENKLSSKIEDLQCLSKVLEIRNEPVTK